LDDRLAFTLLLPGKIVHYYFKKTSRYCSADIIFEYTKISLSS